MTQPTPSAKELTLKEPTTLIEHLNRIENFLFAIKVGITAEGITTVKMQDAALADIKTMQGDLDFIRATLDRAGTTDDRGLAELRAWCEERRSFFEEQWKVMKESNYPDKDSKMYADELSAWQYHMVMDKIDSLDKSRGDSTKAGDKA